MNSYLSTLKGLPYDHYKITVEYFPNIIDQRKKFTDTNIIFKSELLFKGMVAMYVKQNADKYIPNIIQQISSIFLRFDIFVKNKNLTNLSNTFERANKYDLSDTKKLEVNECILLQSKIDDLEFKLKELNVYNE